MTTFEELRTVPVLDSLSDEVLRVVLERGEERFVAAGEVNGREGEPVEHLYVILEGELRILFARPRPEVSGSIPLFAIRPKTHAALDDSLDALQRNAAAPRDFSRKIPEPVVVVVQVDGQPA